MKTIRIIVAIVALAGLALIGYANLRFVNPSAQLEPIDVRTLEVKNSEGMDASAVQKHILSNSAIRACSIDKEKGTIGITYYYQRLNEQALIDWVSMDGKLAVAKKVFAASTSPECPVNGMRVMWSKTLDALRFR